jgi:hypothetical protein
MIVLASLPLLYGLSFGPVCGLVENQKLPIGETASFYRPLVRASTCRFRPVAVALRWYADFFALDRTVVGNGSSVVDRMNSALTLYDLTKAMGRKWRAEQRSLRATHGDQMPRGTATEGP